MPIRGVVLIYRILDVKINTSINSLLIILFGFLRPYKLPQEPSNANMQGFL